MARRPAATDVLLALVLGSGDAGRPAVRRRARRRRRGGAAGRRRLRGDRPPAARAPPARRRRERARADRRRLRSSCARGMRMGARDRSRASRSSARRATARRAVAEAERSAPRRRADGRADAASFDGIEATRRIVALDGPADPGPAAEHVRPRGVPGPGGPRGGQRRHAQGHAGRRARGRGSARWRDGDALVDPRDDGPTWSPPGGQGRGPRRRRSTGSRGAESYDVGLRGGLAPRRVLTRRSAALGGEVAALLERAGCPRPRGRPCCSRTRRGWHEARGSVRRERERAAREPEPPRQGPAAVSWCRAAAALGRQPCGRLGCSAPPPGSRCTAGSTLSAADFAAKLKKNKKVPGLDPGRAPAAAAPR